MEALSRPATSLRRLASFLPVALVVAAFFSALAAHQASAADPYCGASYAVGGDCYGPRHSLGANAACIPSSNPPNCGAGAGVVAVSALDTNLHQYGNWITGSNHACHPYSGANLLYPWLWNPGPSGVSIQGWEYYGADNYYC